MKKEKKFFIILSLVLVITAIAFGWQYFFIGLPKKADLEFKFKDISVECVDDEWIEGMRDYSSGYFKDNFKLSKSKIEEIHKNPGKYAIVCVNGYVDNQNDFEVYKILPEGISSQTGELPFGYVLQRNKQEQYHSYSVNAKAEKEYCIKILADLSETDIDDISTYINENAKFQLNGYKLYR